MLANHKPYWSLNQVFQKEIFSLIVYDKELLVEAIRLSPPHHLHPKNPNQQLFFTKTQKQKQTSRALKQILK